MTELAAWRPGMPFEAALAEAAQETDSLLDRLIAVPSGLSSLTVGVVATSISGAQATAQVVLNVQPFAPPVVTLPPSPVCYVCSGPTKPRHSLRRRQARLFCSSFNTICDKSADYPKRRLRNTPPS